MFSVSVHLSLSCAIFELYFLQLWGKCRDKHGALLKSIFVQPVSSPDDLDVESQTAAPPLRIPTKDGWAQVFVKVTSL